MPRVSYTDIVTIGGGGGHSTVLRGLRKLPNARITAIVPNTDTGGSTGYLTREYGSYGFLGDLTKCVASLCPDETVGRALMHRFDRGVLAGHSVKNILMVGMQEATGVTGAVSLFGQVAGIAPHRVIPVTYASTELRAALRIGNEVRGETNIDLIAQNPLWHPHAHAIEKVFLRPHVTASGDARRALRSARCIVVCPGDLYSSILPVLLPSGIRSAIRASRAHVVVVLNIMTKQGETQGYRAEDFLSTIETHLGRSADTVLMNSAPIPRSAKLPYALEHKVQLETGSLRSDPRVRLVPLLHRTPAGELYHDSDAVAGQVRRILRGK